jgi:hypothetical protein
MVSPASVIRLLTYLQSHKTQGRQQQQQQQQQQR